jgi:hypothetical protein
VSKASNVDGQAAFNAAVLAVGGTVNGEPATPPTPIPAPREPFPELLAKWEGRRLERAQRLLTEKRAVDALTDALATVTDPVARAVLDLHKSGDRGICAAEMDEYSCGPDWPCQTVEVVATTLGIRFPAHMAY